MQRKRGYHVFSVFLLSIKGWSDKLMNVSLKEYFHERMDMTNE